MQSTMQIVLCGNPTNCLLDLQPIRKKNKETMESLQQYYEIKKYLSGIFINKQSSDSVATIFSDPTVAQF